MLQVKKTFLLLIIITFTSLLSLPAKAACTVSGYIVFINSTPTSNRLMMKSTALSPGYIYMDFTGDDMMSHVTTAHKAKTSVRVTGDIASCPADLHANAVNLGNMTFIMSTYN